MVTPIVMDGVTYRVRIVYDTMRRQFSLRSGPNAGVMLSGREERDLLGTAYGYSMSVEPDPAFRQDYDDFFEAISAPVDTHQITLPYGQSTITYDAMIESGEDTFGGRLGGQNVWKGLTVYYRPIEPQRTPE